MPDVRQEQLPPDRQVPLPLELEFPVIAPHPLPSTPPPLVQLHEYTLFCIQILPYFNN